MEKKEVVPLIKEIIRTSGVIDPMMQVKEVIPLFQQDNDLLGVPLVKDGKYIGYVTRKNFFSKHLGKPFAVELYSKKSIFILKEEFDLSMGSDTDVNMALEKLLMIDPALEIDAFPVVDDGKFTGSVSVADLMMKVSNTQNSLLDTIRKMSERIREEITQASRIQNDLLPDPIFYFKSLVLGAGLTTSTEIGGDFYDYFVIDDNKIGLVIGDVSGHGVQSGMVTTAAKASLHTLVSMGVTTPGELLTKMNTAILQTARQSLLMTCLIALIDLEKGEIIYSNAGHNFPIIFRRVHQDVQFLEEVSGFPLGFDSDTQYTEYSTQFYNGDTLFLYTDGILECENQHGEQFGYDRLREAFKSTINFHPNEMRSILVKKAVEFQGSEDFEDDVSMLIAKTE